MTNPTPGAPVPPDHLVRLWSDEHDYKKHRLHTWYIAEKAAAWGYKQAMPERRELRELLNTVAGLLREHADTLAVDGFSGEAEAGYEVADRARDWAERLGGCSHD